MNTVKWASKPRGMTVGLSQEQASVCKAAMFPVEVVHASDLEDAKKRVAAVLPLVVIVDSAMSEAQVKSLDECVSACGAQIVAIKGTPVLSELQTDLLEAIFTAEQRRSPSPDGA